MEKKLTAKENDLLKVFEDAAQIEAQIDKENQEAETDFFRKKDMFRRALDNGKLPPAEITYIKERLNLKNAKEDELIDDLLKCLAYATEPTSDSIKLIERFFGASDEEGTRGAIQALCRIWGLSDRYVDKLMALINYDVFSDVDSNLVFLSACDAMARYIYKNKDAKVIGQFIWQYEENVKEVYAIKEKLEFVNLIERVLIFGVTGDELNHSVDGFWSITQQEKQIYIDEIRKYMGKH